MTTPKIVLADGSKMPALGLGTWPLRGSQCLSTIREALEIGYTHIDTAEMYENQEDIGKAIAGHDRSRLFITSKIPPGRLSYSNALASAEQTLRELKTDYLDLLLIHWPDKNVDMLKTLDAFAELQQKGKIRSAGVSNFTISHFERILSSSPVAIVNNQVECHPYLSQEQLRRYCESQNITLTAYSPIARRAVLDDAVIERIADEASASPVQVVLAWELARGFAAIPKAGSSKHLADNFGSCEVVLSGAQMEQINALDRNHRCINPPWAEFDD